MDRFLISETDRLVDKSEETVHQCWGTADKNTWLKAMKAAGRVAGMHMRR